jgi:hypothetical protein
MHDERPTRRVGRGSISGGLILIVLGFLWLLNNLGYLPGDLVRSLWRLWPLVLLLLGADVALRGFPDRVALPVLLLVTILVGSLIFVLAPTLPQEQIISDSFSQEIGDLRSASIQLELDRGTLGVDPLRGQPHLLVTAQWDHLNSVLIQKEFTESDGRGTLSLADRYEALLPLYFLGGLTNDWAVQLTPSIPLDLELEGDNCELDLRLDGLTLQTVMAQLDDCSGDVRLPATSGLNASLDLQDSRLTLVLPPTAGARVEVQLSDTDLTIDSSRFIEIQPGVYLSEGYDQAQTQISVSLQASDSAITVR